MPVTIPCLTKSACLVNAGFAGYIINQAANHADAQCEASLVTSLYCVGISVCAYSLFYLAVGSIDSVMGQPDYVMFRMGPKPKICIGVVASLTQLLATVSVLWFVIVMWTADADKCDEALYAVGQTALYWYFLWSVIYCCWMPVMIFVLMPMMRGY